VAASKLTSPVKVADLKSAVPMKVAASKWVSPVKVADRKVTWFGQHIIRSKSIRTAPGGGLRPNR
jgi:hypothetical protein